MPQPFGSAIMTNAGAALLTKVQSGACKMQFTRMAIGDGVYAADEKTVSALQQQTGLKSLRNAYGLSSVEVYTEHSVKVTALITNQDPVTEETLISEGYYINEIGLFAQAVDSEEPEILYSIAVTEAENGDFMPPYNGFNPVQIIQSYFATVSNSAEVTIQGGRGAVALEEDLLALADRVTILETGFAGIIAITDEEVDEIWGTSEGGDGGGGTVDTRRLLPAGGTQGQTLAKASDEDYDVEWVDNASTVEDLTEEEIEEIMEGE